MLIKRSLLVLVVFLFAACAPAVPYDQMPGYGGGGNDLFNNAQNNRWLAEQALREAEAAEAAMSATAQAPIIRMTETAAGLIVQQTQAAGTSRAGQETQQAAITQTAVWWTPTPIPTATPNLTATLDAIAISAAETQTRLLLERETQNNEFNRLKGPIALVLAALVIAWVMILITRRQRFQSAQVDARGNVLPLLDIVEGTVTDVDRNPNFQGSMKNDWMVRLLAHWAKKKWGVELMLPGVTAKRQDEVTYRDQLLDLATRGLPSPSKSEDAKKAKAGDLMTRQLPAPEAPQVQLIAPEFVKPILLDVVPQIAHDAIEAELYETKKEDGEA